MLELLDKQSYFISISAISSVFSIFFFDSFTREDRGGIIFLLFLLYVSATVSFCIFRFIWGIFCSKMLIKKTTNPSIFSRSLFDIIPLFIFILFALFYSRNSAVFIVIPMLIFFMDLFIYDSKLKIKLQFGKLVLSAVFTAAYFGCGFILFHKMNISENLTYLATHFTSYLAPIFLLNSLEIKSNIEKNLFTKHLTKLLPIILVVFIKAILGRISELDIIFGITATVLSKPICFMLTKINPSKSQA